ncbi:unnamed protein product [Brassica rapa subsp. trilocularis]
MLQRKLTVLASPCKFSMSNRNTKGAILCLLSQNQVEKQTKFV